MNKKDKASKDDPTTGDRLGIKGLSKGKRKKLEAYQHLFYLLQVILKCLILSKLIQCTYTISTQPKRFFITHFSLPGLQTNPSYLAKLIFQMPQNKSTKFMDTVIFTLYNYASNQREEYLLLKLFKTALEEEIK